jgi:hypothetical protein
VNANTCSALTQSSAHVAVARNVEYAPVAAIPAANVKSGCSTFRTNSIFNRYDRDDLSRQLFLGDFIGILFSKTPGKFDVDVLHRTTQPVGKTGFSATV